MSAELASTSAATGYESARVIGNLNELAARTGGREDGGSRRLCWTGEWLKARDFLREQLSELPVSVEQDEAGNLWAYLRGARPETVVVGSHLDSVINGGWLDGALGVMAGLELLRSAAVRGTPRCTLALVDFADEEGARFGRSVFGSSAVSGSMVPNELRDLRDRHGDRLEDVVADHGVDLNAILGARARLEHVRAYLELHIEQGPVLESEGLAVATVLGTKGVERHVLRFEGHAAHAGSTPTEQRRDAFLAAARTALQLREIARSHDGVCTVGSVVCEPGQVTVVPGVAEMLVDQRHVEAGALAQMIEQLRGDATRIAGEEGCSVSFRRLLQLEPIAFDPELVEIGRSVARELSATDRALPSGPLHDATEMARVVPTVMLFASSTAGISHAADEDTPVEHLHLASRILGAAAARVIDRVGAS